MEQTMTERPRCRICGRRLRSIPWKDLGIGPVCARRWRTEELYRTRFIELKLRPKFEDERLLQAEIDALDAKIRESAAYHA